MIHFSHLEYSEYCLHLHFYNHNDSADISFKFLQGFHVNLKKTPPIKEPFLYQRGRLFYFCSHDRVKMLNNCMCTLLFLPFFWNWTCNFQRISLKKTLFNQMPYPLFHVSQRTYGAQKEGRKICRPKRSQYKKWRWRHFLNILSIKNYLAPSQKFRRIMINTCYFYKIFWNPFRYMLLCWVFLICSFINCILLCASKRKLS